MSLKKQGDDSLYQEIKKLDEEIKKLRKEKEKIEDKWKRLLMEEDVSKGKIYAPELHKLMQKKLMLEVEIDYRIKKKNRLMFYIT